MLIPAGRGNARAVAAVARQPPIRPRRPGRAHGRRWQFLQQRGIGLVDERLHRRPRPGHRDPDAAAQGDRSGGDGHGDRLGSHAVEDPGGEGLGLGDGGPTLEIEQVRLDQDALVLDLAVVLLGNRSERVAAAHDVREGVRFVGRARERGEREQPHTEPPEASQHATNPFERWPGGQAAVAVRPVGRFTSRSAWRKREGCSSG